MTRSFVDLLGDVYRLGHAYGLGVLGRDRACVLARGLLGLNVRRARLVCLECFSEGYRDGRSLRRCAN